MANEEHLKILLRGIDEWNEWRKATRNKISPDLSQISLIDHDLHDADFHLTDLSGTDLTEADLSNALLLKANLTGARMHRTQLTRANLSEADLSEADLTGAMLVSADLASANFSRANLTNSALLLSVLDRTDLSDANVHGAAIGRTTFFDVDLTHARGLETCEHAFPSALDPLTLSRSGSLPITFLRGCGLPDSWIEYLPALRGDPIEYYSCFISYSSADDEFASRLRADLQDNGVRCWFAPEDMKIGDRPMREINEAIRLRDKLVLILSEASIASDWVEHEVSQALEEEERRSTDAIFPIRIDSAVMKSGFGWAKRLREAHKPEGRHIGDFTGWKDHDTYQAALERLLRDLKTTGEEWGESP